MIPMERLRYLVLAAQRQGERALTARLKDLNTTPSQAEALRVLADYGPLTLKELGGHLICEGGSPSRLVAGLVQKGLVVSTEVAEDRRAKLLALSGRGVEVAHQIEEQEKRFYAAYDIKMSSERQAVIAQAIDSLIDDPQLVSALRARGILSGADDRGDK